MRRGLSVHHDAHHTASCCASLVALALFCALSAHADSAADPPAKRLTVGDTFAIDATLRLGLDVQGLEEPLRMAFRVTLEVAGEVEGTLAFDVRFDVKAVEYEGPYLAFAVHPSGETEEATLEALRRFRREAAGTRISWSRSAAANRVVHDLRELAGAAVGLHGGGARVLGTPGARPWVSFVERREGGLGRVEQGEVEEADRLALALVQIALPPVPREPAFGEPFAAGGAPFAVTRGDSLQDPIATTVVHIEALSVSAFARSVFAFESLWRPASARTSAVLRAREWADVAGSVAIAVRRSIAVTSRLALDEGDEVVAIARWEAWLAEGRVGALEARKSGLGR